MPPSPHSLPLTSPHLASPPPPCLPICPPACPLPLPPAANIFIGSLIFIEELADKIVEAVGPARDTLDACLIFPSMPAVMKLNKLGTFSMSQLGGGGKSAIGEPRGSPGLGPCTGAARSFVCLVVLGAWAGDGDAACAWAALASFLGGGGGGAAADPLRC